MLSNLTLQRASIVLAAPCLWLCTAARAEDYPPRKPGLWEVRITPDAMSGRPPMGAVQQCVDANTDRLMREMGGGAVGRDCSKQDVRHEAGRLVIDSVCKMQMAGNPTTATTHAVITGSFDSSYRMESKSSYNPPFMGRSEGGVTMDAKWLGPCKADQKPGDMVMPGGMKVNVLDAASAAGTKK